MADDGAEGSRGNYSGGSSGEPSESDVGRLGGAVTQPDLEPTPQASWREERRPDGTVIKEAKLETADIALIFVFLLCLVLLAMAIFIDSMRDGLNGALPYLLGLFALAIGGVEAWRVVTGKNTAAQ